MAYFTERASLVQLKEPLSVPTQVVIGFPISSLSFSGLVDVMIEWACIRASRVVCVSNVHMLMEGHWNQDFANVLLTADLLTPDGMPLVWMASLMNGQPQERAAGMELMLALCRKAQAADVSLFFYGSTPEMLAKMRSRLAQDFPELKIAGMIAPPFRPLTPEEDRDITAQINRSGAGLVFVSLGCPKQERWMSEHRGRVNAVMVGLGGVFPVYSGNKRWAPAWMRQYGLEWFYRLKQDPRRLWKRYASTIPPFMLLALKQVVQVRLGLAGSLSSKERRFKDR